MFETKRSGWMKHADFVLLDILCQQAAFTLAYMLRFQGQLPYRNGDYRELAVIFILLGLFVPFAFDTFEGAMNRGFYKEFSASVRHVLLVEGFGFVYIFGVQRGYDYSRLFVFGMIPLYVLGTYLGRLLWKKRLKKRRLESSGKSIIVVAPLARVEGCIQNLQRVEAAYAFVGAVVMDLDCAGAVVAQAPVVANYHTALEYIRREWVDEVFVDLRLGEGYPMDFIDQVRRMGVVVHIPITPPESFMENAQQIERLGGYTVLTVGINCATPLELWLKRLLDIVGGLVGCLITGALFLVLALPITLSSPGPVFFTQERVGRGGKKFKLYKFRTMVPDAERQKAALMAGNRIEGGRMFKLEDDPRVIGTRLLPDGTVKKGLGSFLRETSLDEFPQMLNVLRGDMSLVGTRPPTVDEWERYEFHHRARMAFRPGVTGLWQVSGRSSITDFEQVVRLDTRYIDEWSLGLDIKILLKTLRVVFGRWGAL